MKMISNKMVRNYSPILRAAFLIFLGNNLHFLTPRSEQSTPTSWVATFPAVGEQAVINKTRTQVPRKSSVSFVFFIGLEGTGHHLVRTIIKNSPDVVRANNDLTMRNDTLELKKHLFYHSKQSGLWNAHCNENPEEVNVTRSHDKVVDYLSKINKRANGDEITVPVNIILVPGMHIYGMVSYPNFDGDCRSLNYPNLDHFYHACDVAGVECKHAYMYRDPYLVLASTTVRRKFNKNGALQGVHLYTSLLQIIYSQLLDHSDRTVACLGFYEPTISVDEVWNPIRDMFGWKNQTEFDSHVQKVYRPPKPMTENERSDMMPPHLELYMESYVRAHDKVVKLCREQTAANS
jgi:hypothetical protein